MQQTCYIRKVSCANDRSAGGNIRWNGMSVSPYSSHFHFRVVAPERIDNPTRNRSTCCWTLVISFSVLCPPTGRVKQKVITKLCSAVVRLSRLMYDVHYMNKMARYALQTLRSLELIYRMIKKDGLHFVSLYFKQRTNDKYDIKYI
jgi:hypothetical protein